MQFLLSVQSGVQESTREGRAVRCLATLLRVLPAVALVYFLVWCYIAIRPAHLWDDAEPEVLNLAWRLSRGEEIYKSIDSPPYIHAAYTPLYLYAAAGMLKLTSLSTLPAKLISMLSALAIGLAFARLSREWLGSSRQGWLLFSALFLVPAFLYNTARVHVQMMAVALSLWSLVVFLRGRRLDLALWSPLLAVLAIYAKQTQIAWPIAAGLYLLLREPRRLVAFAPALVLMGLAPLPLLQQTTGGLFFRHIVEWNSLTYQFVVLVLTFLEHVGPGLVFVGLACSVGARRVRDGQAGPVDYYFLVAAVLGVASLGRVGAHTQYTVELHTLALLLLLRAGGFAALQGKAALLCVQLLVLVAYTPVFMSQKAWRALPSYAAAPKVHALLRDSPGPIISEQGSFALFSGREPYIQLFHFAGLARAGQWDETKLVREIEKRTFPWIITEFPLDKEQWSLGRHAERFNPPVVSAILRNYQRKERVGPYYLYAPKP